MKNKFLISEASSKAALEDAKNFGLSATLEKKDDQFFISYESKASYGENEEKDKCSPTWDDYYNLSKSIYQEMQYQLKWIREDYQYLSQAFYKHKEGHIPPILDRGKLQAAIDTLGIGDSYEVKRAEVYIQY